jgi:HEAT repeat protein
MHCRYWPLIPLAVFTLTLTARSEGRLDEIIDSPMYSTPQLPAPREVIEFPEGAIPLWLKALERPEADMRCKAADAIALAQRRGMKGLETTVAPLIAAIDRADQHPAVRLALAHALIALDARQAAPSLFKLLNDSPSDLRNLIEPALARWEHRPARALWLARLGDPAAGPRTLVLAIRGLAALRETAAGARLLEMVHSAHLPSSVRLEAARALGSLRNTGLEKDAERLAADASPRGLVARLAAASLLSEHRSETAIHLLQRLAQDSEPALASLAASRLLAIDPRHGLAVLDSLLASPDATVRAAGVAVLARLPSEKHIQLLSDRLDDPDPGLRIQVRFLLRELAGKKEFHDTVIAQTSRQLKTAKWRALEQATILLTQLDHKPAADRLVELLEFTRPEVFVAAAWGLRNLAVPETLPAVMKYVDARSRVLRTPLNQLARLPVEMIDHQLSQLNQFLGMKKYQKADPILRRFIPYAVFSECRAAAIWALGMIFEGTPVPALTGPLDQRLNASSTIPPEFPQVRGMSAITLARLQAREALPSLRKFFPDKKPTVDLVNNACGWAIERLTGEAMPPAKTIPKPLPGWFLVPMK